MKHYTATEIKEVRNNINNGMKYCGIRNDYGTGLIYLTTNGYIGWQHYGQSANKNTDRDMRWLIENIFNECECVTPCEYSEYCVNYVPIDKQYKGIDMSSSHPNVYGL